MLHKPALLLRLEALTVLFASCAFYAFGLHGTWLLFAALFLVPDVSLLGHASARSRPYAASFYNLVHSYIGPMALLLLAWHSSALRAGQVGAIWMAHIAMDRLLGFGLKYPNAFQPTHIQSAQIWRAGS
jgi:hypothetical protein